MARPKILIVEPRKALREQLRDALEETFDVLPAQTESGAVQGFKRHAPAAVLLGMTQRSGNGFDLASKLRDEGVGIPPYTIVYGRDESVPELPADLDLKARYGVDRYFASGVTAKRLETVLKDKLRGSGWQATKMDAGAAPVPKKTAYSHPMLSDDALSARKEPPAKEGFSFKRLFGR